MLESNSSRYVKCSTISTGNGHFIWEFPLKHSNLSDLKLKSTIMRKLCFMTLILMGAFLSVNAQQGPLNDYLGKYIFAEGSPVAEVSLTTQDSSLVINSAMGSTVLEKKGVDSFYLANYDALVIQLMMISAKQIMMSKLLITWQSSLSSEIGMCE